MPGADLLLETGYFIPANDTTIWLARIPLWTKLPELVILGSSTAAVDAETITVSATTTALFKNFPLKFAKYDTVDPTLIVSRSDALLLEDAPIGSTALSIYPLKVAIAADQDCVLYDFKPVYSCKSGNMETSANTAMGSNFRDQWEEAAVGSRSWRIPMQGTLDASDPAFAILKEFNGKSGINAYLYAMLVYGDGSAYEGRVLVTDLRQTGAKDQFVELAWTFVGSGTLGQDTYSW